MKSKIPVALAAMAFSGVLAAGAAQTGGEAGSPGLQQGTGAQVGEEARPQAGVVDRPGIGADIDVAHQELFKSLDVDGDGYISREELLSWFEEHDKAGDGRLSPSEFAAFLEGEREMIERDPARPGEPGEPAAVPAQPPTGPDVADPTPGAPGEMTR
jgi:hypothetical protein